MNYFITTPFYKKMRKEKILRKTKRSNLYSVQDKE